MSESLSATPRMATLATYTARRGRRHVGLRSRRHRPILLCFRARLSRKRRAVPVVQSRFQQFQDAFCTTRWNTRTEWAHLPTHPGPFRSRDLHVRGGLAAPQNFMISTREHSHQKAYIHSAYPEDKAAPHHLSDAAKSSQCPRTAARNACDRL